MVLILLRRFRDLIPLKPVMTLKTHIHFLKSVPPGTKISYGGTFVTKRESLIATLPIGYADGYSRHLSNQGEVLIRGKRAPIVGKSMYGFHHGRCDRYSQCFFRR